MSSYVELSSDGKRIELSVEYRPGINMLCRQVSGYRFDGETRKWSYPLKMSVCLSLRQVFGEGMQVGPKLTRWALRERMAGIKSREISERKDSDLALVKQSHPEFWEAMSARPFQRSGAEFLASLGSAACFDEPGLGKTAELIAAVIQAGRWNGRHLVIVSNKTAIRSTWELEINKWTPDAKTYPMPDGRVAREKQFDRFMADEEGARFLIILPHMLQVKIGKWCNKCKMWDDQEFPMSHYEKNHKCHQKDRKIDWPELLEMKWDSVIADECHDYLLRLRPPSMGHQPQWAHGMRRVGKNAQMRLSATGTPFRGSETNIFGILHWLDPKRYSSYWSWVESWFEITQTDFQIRGGDRGESGKSLRVGALREQMKEGFYEELDSLCLRRTRREVRNDIPEIDPQEHWVTLEGEHKRQYEEFEEKGYVLLESGVLEGMGRLSEITRIRQFAFGPWDVEYASPDMADVYEQTEPPVIKMTPLVEKSPKVRLMMDMLRERGALRPKKEMHLSERKFIIASQYVTVIEGIRSMLTGMGVSSLKITGDVSAVMRALAVKSFNEPGGPTILLLNTKAGGASLTLDRFCDEMFIMDETWVHDDQVQLIGRINNRGKDIRPRTIHLFRTEDTIDERIAIGNDDQSNMQSMILDTRRGQEVGLSLLRRKA